MAGSRDCLTAITFEILHPCAQRTRVVFAQILDVADVEAGLFGELQALRDVYEFSVGKNKTSHEACGLSIARVALMHRNSVIQKESARLEQPVCGGKVFG